MGDYRTRRLIWVLLAAAVMGVLIYPVRMRMLVSPPAYQLYRAVEALPKNKLLIVSCSWEAGTKGENAPQTEAILRHAFQRGLPVAIFGLNYAAGPMLAGDIAAQVAPEYGRKYGRDWVNWGYRTGGSQMVAGLARDIPGTIRQDVNKTPVDKIPVMRGVNNIKDVSMIIEITPSLTVPIFIRYLYGVYRTPIGYACTGVMAPEAFPYLDSGQLVGMLKGLTGAAEYETLIGHPAKGMAGMGPQSFAHLVVIAIILLGNILYLRERARSRRP